MYPLVTTAESPQIQPYIKGFSNNKNYAIQRATSLKIETAVNFMNMYLEGKFQTISYHLLAEKSQVLHTAVLEFKVKNLIIVSC